MASNNSATLQLANLTYKLLSNCQQKEIKLSQNFGLTQAEFRCLRFFQSNEVINNKEIAERMDLSPSRLTRIIDGLVAKSYVTREIEPNDRRNMRVALSQNGINLVEKLNDSYIDIHKEILKDFDESQQEMLIKAMSNLLKALEEWVQEP
jgi:DNA-binding MarR family transcriptional regulator